MGKQLSKWPKTVPQLTFEQERAREGWMRYWHEILPNKFGVVEKFNHGFPAQLSHRVNCRTLEIGAGLGEHLRWENLENQDYYCLEYRKEWVEILKTKYREDRVFWGDIHQAQPFEAGFFDRVIAIHVLEHLPDLPRAVTEIHRLLKVGGHFDIVIPCEGGIAYHLAREMTSARMFKKKFGMSYRPIMKAEHINQYPEIIECLNQQNWSWEKRRYFPLGLPSWQTNFCVGLRLQKNK